MKRPQLAELGKTAVIAAGPLGLVLAVVLAINAAWCGSPEPSPAHPKLGAQFPNYVTTAAGLPTFNVQAYGAAGDGVTDDHTAIKNAMAAACAASQPAMVFFPAGKYVVARDASHSYSLSIPCAHLTLQGVPGQSVIIQPSGMVNSQVLIIQDIKQNDLTIRDLTIDGNWQNAAGLISSAMEGLALMEQKEQGGA